MFQTLALQNQWIARVLSLPIDNPNRARWLRNAINFRNKIFQSIAADEESARRRSEGLARVAAAVEKGRQWWESLSAEGKNNVRKWGDSSPYE